MNTILTLLLAYGLLAILYRFGLRPLFKSAMLDRMNQREHELEKLVKTGIVSSDDFTYQFLLKRLQLKNHLARCSVSEFLHFVVSSKPPTNALEELKRFQRESSGKPELVKCQTEFCKDFGLWMTLNSPIYTIIGCGIVIALIFFRFVDEATAKRNAMIFPTSEAAGC